MAAGTTDGEATLQLLLDERDCRAVLARYGIAIDWQDRPGLESVFWPDAEVDYGFFKGGATPFVGVLLDIARLSLRRFHMTANEQINLRGATAQAQSCIVTQAISVAEDGSRRSSAFLGRFIDELEKRQGEWRIRRRVYLQHGAYMAAYEESSMLSGMLNADGLTPEHGLFRRA